MIYYKFVTQDNKIIDVSTDERLRYLYRNIDGLILVSKSMKHNVFGVTLGGVRYNVEYLPGVHCSEYETVYQVAISKNEYNRLYDLLHQYSVETTEPVYQQVIPDDLDMYKEQKIRELSQLTQNQIFEGITVVYEGKSSRYTLKLEDQINLQSLQLRILRGETDLIYHAVNEQCRIYSVEEIQRVIDEANKHVQFRLLMFNQARYDVTQATTIKAIQQIALENYS